MPDRLIVYNSRNAFFKSPFGAAPTGSDVRFRIAVRESAGLAEASMRFWYDGAEKFVKMARDESEWECGYSVFGADFHTGGKPRLVWYYFIVTDAEGRISYYGNNPDMLGGEGAQYDNPPWSYQLTVYDGAFRVPGWLRHGVIYQIFPDRFYQERPAPLTQAEIEKKRPDYIFQPDWNAKPVYYPDPRTGEIMNNDFYGGNLAGIAAKLPYLKDLGVSIIYLNPIFEAYSNHRYDTGDYFKVDPLLGTNDDFAALCVQARQYGMRIILDGVFNHTGSDSIYFNKDGYYDGVGAYQSKDSKYYSWYLFEDYPDKYESWWGVATLPDVNESDPGFIRHVVSGEHSVIKYWLRLGASGWRLDVVDELPGAFVKELRANVKKTDADAAIIGEVWEDASNKVSYGKQREYLLGFELDSVMNYVFKKALIAFMLGDIGAERFDAENMRLAENYPAESYYSLMNLIGGHDVERILTIMSEPPRDLTRAQKAMYKPTRAKYSLGVRRLKIMSLIQMTFPGTPSVYYGDEAGMTGFEDPFNRCAFPWDGADGDLHAWYRQIIALRNANPVLRTGGFETVYAAGSAYAYAREIKGGADVFGAPAQNGFALVAVNRDKECPAYFDIDLSGRGIPSLRDALEAADGARGGGPAPDGTERLSDGSVRMPDGSVRMPDGSVRMPDGTVRMPDGSVRLPNGSARQVDPLPEGRESRFVYDGKRLIIVLGPLGFKALMS